MSDFMNKFGGEVLLKSQFPALHAFLSNAKEADIADDCFAGITALADSGSNICTQTKVNLANISPLIVTTVDIYDVNGRLVETFNTFDTDIMYSEANHTLSVDTAKFAIKGDLKAIATFLYADPQTGETIKNTVEFLNGNYYDGTEVIKSTDVFKPRAKDHTLTRVSYERNAWVPNFDYSYTDVKESEYVAKIHMPFSGECVVDPMFKIVKICNDYGWGEFNLSLLHSTSTVAVYKNPKSVAQFVIDNKNHKFSWDFDDDWCVTKDLHEYGVNTVLSLSCLIPVLLEKITAEGEDPVQLVAKVLINSTADSSTVTDNPSTVFIEPIFIQWGCLAKDTKLTVVVNGVNTEKLISEVAVGDMVVTQKGTAKITNVYTGSEQQLVYMATEKGKSIKATLTHPMQTARGVVTVEKMNYADKLVTIDGEEVLTDMYFVEYNDTVYNIQLDKPDVFSCNGILTGDYTIQNSENDNPKVSLPYDSEKYKQLQKEAVTLFGGQASTK